MYQLVSTSAKSLTLAEAAKLSKVSRSKVTESISSRVLARIYLSNN